ncbi:MAG TPA: class F sortase [Marmoricola sp.]|nr:class F sortase [Marmoricola sp.]
MMTRTRGWWGRTGVVSTLLGLAGGAALVMAVVNQPPAPPAVEAGAVRASSAPATPAPSPTAERARVPGGTAKNPDLVHGLVLPESEPVRVRIPRIEVTSPLVPLGLDETGALEVPEDGRQAGWYTRAPTPGALGPAVIAGHVTWDLEPAIFFRLGEVRRSDRVEVLRADGSTAVFAVRRVVSFAKSRFPSAAVYGPTNHAALRLITCAGEYDAAAGGYEDNVVVFAALVHVRH